MIVLFELCFTFYIQKSILFQIMTVGEFRKTRHPRNVEVNEIFDASFQVQRTHEDLESGIHKVSKSRMRGELDSRTLKVSESRTRDGSES
jgi:hypothetical protein